MSCSSDNHHNHVHGHNSHRPGVKSDLNYRKTSKLRSRSPSSECLSRCCSRSSSRSSSSGSSSSHSCSCSSCCSSGSSASSTSSSGSSSSSSDEEDELERRVSDRDIRCTQQPPSVQGNKPTKYVLSTTREPLKLTISKSSLGLGTSQPRSQIESQSSSGTPVKIQSACRSDQLSRKPNQPCPPSSIGLDRDNLRIATGLEKNGNRDAKQDSVVTTQVKSPQAKQAVPSEARQKLRSIRINQIRSRSNTQSSNVSAPKEAAISQSNTPSVFVREQMNITPTKAGEIPASRKVPSSACIRGLSSTQVSSQVQTAPLGLPVNVINIPVTKSFTPSSTPIICTQISPPTPLILPIYTKPASIDANPQHSKEPSSEPFVSATKTKPLCSDSKSVGMSSTDRKPPPLKSLKLIKEMNKKNSNQLDGDKRKLVVDESKLIIGSRASIVTPEIPVVDKLPAPSDFQQFPLTNSSTMSPVSTSVKRTGILQSKAPQPVELKNRKLVTKAARKCMSFNESSSSTDVQSREVREVFLENKRDELKTEQISPEQLDFGRNELRKQHLFLTSSNPDLFSPPIKRRDLTSPSSHSITSSNPSLASPCIRQEWTKEDKSNCKDKSNKKKQTKSSQSTCQSKKQKTVPTKAAVKCMFSDSKHEEKQKPKILRKAVGPAEFNRLIDSLDEMKIDETRKCSRRILRQSNNCFSSSKSTSQKLHSPMSSIFTESKSVTPNSLKKYSVSSPCPPPTTLLSPSLRNEVLQQNLYSNQLLQHLNLYNELMKNQFAATPSTHMQPSPRLLMPPMLASQLIWPKILSHLQSVAPVPIPSHNLNFDSPKSYNSFSPGNIKFKPLIPSSALSHGKGRERKFRHKKHGIDEVSASRSCSREDLKKKKKKSKKSRKNDKVPHANHGLEGSDLHYEYGQEQVSRSHKSKGFSNEKEGIDGGGGGSTSRKTGKRHVAMNSRNETFCPLNNDVLRNRDGMRKKKDEGRETRLRKEESRSEGKGGEKFKALEKEERGEHLVASKKKETTRTRYQQRPPSNVSNHSVDSPLSKIANTADEMKELSEFPRDHQSSTISAASTVDQVIEECSRIPPEMSDGYSFSRANCNEEIKYAISSSTLKSCMSKIPKVKVGSTRKPTNIDSSPYDCLDVKAGKSMPRDFETLDEKVCITLKGSPRLGVDTVKLTTTSLFSPNCDRLSTDLIANNMRQSLIVAPVNVSSLNPPSSSLVSLQIGGSLSSASVSGDKPSTSSNSIDPQPSTSSQSDETIKPSEVFVTEETPDYCTSQDNPKTVGVITSSISCLSKLSKKRKRANRTGWDKPKKKAKKSESSFSSGGPTSVASLVGQDEVIASSPTDTSSPSTSFNVSPIIPAPKLAKKKPMIKAAKPMTVSESVSVAPSTRRRVKKLVEEPRKEVEKPAQEKETAKSTEKAKEVEKASKGKKVPPIKKTTTKHMAKIEVEETDVKIVELKSSVIENVAEAKVAGTQMNKTISKKPQPVQGKDIGTKKLKMASKNDRESSPEYDPATAPFIVITAPSKFTGDSAKKKINRVRKNSMYKLPNKKFFKSGFFSDDYKIDLNCPISIETNLPGTSDSSAANSSGKSEIPLITNSSDVPTASGEVLQESMNKPNVISTATDPSAVSSTSTSASSSPLHSADESDILEVMKDSVRSRPLLPPPVYSDAEVRFKMHEFILPYDCYVHKLEMKETMDAGKKYRKIKQNIFADIKPVSNMEETICECKRPPPDTTEEGCDSHCLNRCMWIECDPHLCPCGDKCSNQRMQKSRWAAGLERFMTNNRGWGVRTTEKIKEGDFILEYIGEIVSMKLFADRMVNLYHNDSHHYCLSLGPNTVIDGYRTANEGRFVNHSCEPNCVMQKWSANGLFRMGLFAARDIEPGEELSYDYNFDSYNAETQQICKCGSKKCRGVIGGRRKGSGSVPGSERRGSSDSSIASSLPSISSSKKLKVASKPRTKNPVKRKEQPPKPNVMPEQVVSVKEEGKEADEEKALDTSASPVIISQSFSSSDVKLSESECNVNELLKETSGVIASSPLSDPLNGVRRDEESKPLKKRKLKESQQVSSQVDDSTKAEEGQKCT